MLLQLALVLLYSASLVGMGREQEKKELILSKTDTQEVAGNRCTFIDDMQQEMLDSEKRGDYAHAAKLFYKLHMCVGGDLNCWDVPLDERKFIKERVEKKVAYTNFKFDEWAKHNQSAIQKAYEEITLENESERLSSPIWILSFYASLIKVSKLTKELNRFERPENWKAVRQLSYDLFKTSRLNTCSEKRI